jgi:hypothetical protein
MQMARLEEGRLILISHQRSHYPLRSQTTHTQCWIAHLEVVMWLISRDLLVDDLESLMICCYDDFYDEGNALIKMRLFVQMVFKYASCS